MYYSLRGTLIAADGRSAAVECGGVGYLCTVSAQTYSQLPEPGEEVLLYTHLSVREDAMELYGFSTQVERSCFRMLTQCQRRGRQGGDCHPLVPDRRSGGLCHHGRGFQGTDRCSRAWVPSWPSASCWSSRISSARAQPSSLPDRCRLRVPAVMGKRQPGRGSGSPGSPGLQPG